MSRRYVGQRDGDEVIVTVDEKPLPLRLELFNHSPTGFEWGYGGSGPAQLALAIVADVLGVPAKMRAPHFLAEVADERVQRTFAVYQRFKSTHVARWDGDRWEITEDEVKQAIERIEAERWS